MTSSISFLFFGELFCDINNVNPAYSCECQKSIHRHPYSFVRYHGIPEYRHSDFEILVLGPLICVNSSPISLDSKR